MAKVNDNFLNLSESYLFSTIAQKVNDFKSKHPEEKLIRLGIGDVTRPLAPAVINEMVKATVEMGDAATFHGYGPEHGYEFLQRAIIDNDFIPRGVNLELNEVFINDGAKSDTGNIGDILSLNNTIGVTDPVYPVYIDSNAMCGRAGVINNGLWSNIKYIPCTRDNNFIPEIPDERIDIIYLCYPNNPTGTVLSYSELKKWVDYALENESIIMYDAAYEAYIQDDNIPHSIYEIEGAKQCAIEFHSYSKTAGFTGIRCGYTIVPNELKAYAKNGVKVALNPIWNRRQCTKFNGTNYITQRGAFATYSEEGKSQIKDTINYYMANASLMRESLLSLGLEVYGGENAPYIWLKTPDNKSSWQFFDEMLNKVFVVSTPGVGFGPSGEGYLRLTAFGRSEDCEEAMYRIKKWL